MAITFVKIKLKGYILSGPPLVPPYNWGTKEDPDWYIEFKDPKEDYIYWKQKEDGGELLEMK